MKASSKTWCLGLLAVAISGYPLVSPLPLLLSVESRTVSILFRVAALLYCLAVGYHYFVRRRISLGRFGKTYLLFWAMYSARLIYETIAEPESLGRPVYEYYLFAFFVTLIPSLTCYLRLNKEEALIAGKILWVMCVIASSGVVGIYLMGDVGQVELGRFSLETLNAITAGHLGLTLFFMSVTLYSLLSTRFRWLALVTAATGLALMGVSNSRGAFMSFLVVLGTFYVISAVRIFRTGALKTITILSLSSVAILTLSVPILRYTENSYGFSSLSGLELMGSADDQSAQYRKTSFQGAWDQFLESPVLGDALEEKTTKFYPHNNILEAFMTTGMVGGAILVFLYVVSFINAIRLIASRSTYTWIGVVLLQYLVGSLFSGAIWASDGLFCLMAVASASVGVAQRVQLPGAVQITGRTDAFLRR